MNFLRETSGKASARLSLGEALRTMFADAQRLTASGDDQAVHSARKEMKNIRAALRLLRGQLSADVYRLTNMQVRDAAAPLTPVRDALVLLQTLQSVASANCGIKERASVQTMRQALQSQYRKECRALTAERRAQIGERLQRALATLEAHCATTDDAAAGKTGMKAMYRAGRHAYRTAHDHRTTEALHEWRKQVKYLYNGAQLMHRAYPIKLRRIRRKAKKLAELLGDDHDLALLHEALKKARSAPSKRLLARIRRHRRRLQTQAFDLGKLFFAQSTRRFSAKLRRL